MKKQDKTTEHYQVRSKRVSQKRRVRSWWLRIKQIMLVTMAVSICVAVGWLSYSGAFSRLVGQTHHNLLHYSSQWGWHVESIYIEGHDHVETQAITVALALDDYALDRHVPMLGLDLTALQQQVESLRWIKRATITRQLPSTIHVAVIERVPFALWQLNDTLRLVDKSGIVIEESLVDNLHDFSAYAHLPIVIGEDAPMHAPAILATLREEPLLFERVTSLMRIGNRRWNVMIDDQIAIYLPEHDPEKAWKRLAKLNFQENILQSNVKYIDLRIEDRVSIRPH